jgi:lipopolysaccharide/colanic/teichoic acid biosynthesis glycosyltransferase
MILSEPMSLFLKMRYPMLMLISFGMMILYAAVLWGVYFVMEENHISAIPKTIITSAIILGLSFLFSLLGLTKLSRISVWDVNSQIFPLWLSLTAVGLLMVLVFRLDYSIVFILINWGIGLILLIFMGKIITRVQNVVYAVLPKVDLDGLDLGDNRIIKMDELNLPDDFNADQFVDAVIATNEEIINPDYVPMLNKLAINKIPVLPDELFREQITGQINHQRVDAVDLIQLQRYRRYMVIKRLFDIIMAMAGLLVLAPLMVVVAVLIKIESKGPAIFIQSRVGEGGREFKMYKFRSMVQNAESNDMKATITNDDRITPLGHIIRKFRIDELPQLINVLTGKMSMIGPRPEYTAFFDNLSAEIPFYSLRHAVRPGITGWAQVMQGHANDIPSTNIKLSYDLFYIKNLSLMMDFVIFFKTIKTIITGFGSR